MKSVASLLRWSVGILLLGPVLPTLSAKVLLTSVYSAVADDYRRERQPNGAYVRERYAIANAGVLPGTLRDQGMERVPFSELAGALAEYLGSQNYFLANDTKSADLLLVIHWGSTIPYDRGTYNLALSNAATAMGNKAGSGGDGAFESAMAFLYMLNRGRDQVNAQNALQLGYIDEVNKRNTIARWAGGGDAYNDLIADLEESRYYIVISAYDFDAMAAGKKPRPRWETRVSIRAPGHSFRNNFRTMVARAAPYFGQDSQRLVRDRTYVEIGEARPFDEQAGNP